MSFFSVAAVSTYTVSMITSVQIIICDIQLYYAAKYGNRPANTRRLPNVGSMLARRLRHRSNIEPTLGKRLVFAGIKPQFTMKYIHLPLYRTCRPSWYILRISTLERLLLSLFLFFYLLHCMSILCRLYTIITFFSVGYFCVFWAVE